MSNVKDVFTNKVTRGSSAARTQVSLDQLIQRVHQQIHEVQHTIEPRSFHYARAAMRISCKSWERQGRSIDFFVNPSDMRWTLPRRGTVVKTQAGTVRNTWRNRYRGTYYDEGTVGITFQTGNIMPSTAHAGNFALYSAERLIAEMSNPRVPPGLLNFYNFMELLDVPMLWGAGENRHTIEHHSRVFPNLKLEGFFTDDSLTFSEISTDGNRLQWEATFQIYKTSPRFNIASQMATSYTNWVRSCAMDETFGGDNASAYVTGTTSAAKGGAPPPPPPPNTSGSSNNKPREIATSKAKRVNIAPRATRSLTAPRFGPSGLGVL